MFHWPRIVAHGLCPIRLNEPHYESSRRSNARSAPSLHPPAIRKPCHHAAITVLQTIPTVLVEQFYGSKRFRTVSRSKSFLESTEWPPNLSRSTDAYEPFRQLLVRTSRMFFVRERRDFLYVSLFRFMSAKHFHPKTLPAFVRSQSERTPTVYSPHANCR